MKPIARALAAVVFALLFVCLVLPVGALVRLLADPMRLGRRHRKAASHLRRLGGGRS